MQDDVDVYRSFSNMQLGGFAVSDTTGWLASAAQPEFLRCVLDCAQLAQQD